MLKNASTFLVWFLLAIVILLALIYLLQHRLLYFPQKYSMPELVLATEQNAVTLWPSPDEAYRGLLLSRSPSARGTIIVFHGNGGSALNRLYYLAPLERLGFRVLLAEYPGYGAREGRPRESILITDARATVELAKRQFSGPVYLWGESLGCGVATAVAADPSLPVEGLVLITPFANLPDLAQSIYRPLPAKWLVREKYDSEANLRTFRGPVAILVAGQDELIPRQQSQQLYDSLATQKEIWIFAGAGHNTWPISSQEGWWQEAADFVSSY